MDLIADIGATNARCALLDDRGNVVSAEVFENAAFPDVAELLEAYLDHRRTSDRPRRAALAIAAPILSDTVEMINIDWRFSQSQLKESLRLSRLTIVNDFAALAWALPGLGPRDRRQIGPGMPVTHAPLAVIGPGSGLGVATLVPTLDGWSAVSGEGGHATLAAATSDEAAIVELLREETGHCSGERALSGPGIVRMYRALARAAGRESAELSPADVTELARKGEPLANKTLAVFFSLLGTVAGNLALTVGARGGVYIAGGIVPRLLDALQASAFRERFVAKGRYRSYLEPIPTYVITDPVPAFRGLRTLLGYR